MSWWKLKPEDFPEGEPVLKMKRSAWYRDNNRGYCYDFNLTEAGLYDRDEAIRYCFYEEAGEFRNGHCDVIAVPIRQALENYYWTKEAIDRKIERLKELRKWAPDKIED